VSLVVKQLCIQNGEKRLVDIAFTIRSSLALIGESGSGKSLTLKTLLDLTPKNLTKTLHYDFHEPLQRGENIAVVVQNPFTALSPLTKIKNQFFVTREQQIKYMRLVELDTSMLERYPSELSGGQLQRLVLAFALAGEPQVLLLDEATTALDSKTKASILALIKRVQSQIGFLTLFVTHDIDAASQICEDIAVIKEGLIIEEGVLQEVLRNPKRDYTRILIDSNFKQRNKRV
jgi:peptide/nickel transport system ATP-binding protein